MTKSRFINWQFRNFFEGRREVGPWLRVFAFRNRLCVFFQLRKISSFPLLRKFFFFNMWWWSENLLSANALHYYVYRKISNLTKKFATLAFTELAFHVFRTSVHLFYLLCTNNFDSLKILLNYGTTFRTVIESTWS